MVDYSTNGDEGLYLASVNEYDLILLDIMLPIKMVWKFVNFKNFKYSNTNYNAQQKME